MSFRRYRIVVGGKTYDVEVGDTSKSPISVLVNGVTYTVELPSRPQPAVRPVRPSVAPLVRAPSYSAPTAVPAPGPAPAAPVGAGAHAVTAQMPGKVVSVAARVGDHLVRGQPICVIESMKMELTIAAPRECTVSAVHVAAGEAVRSGQVLAEIE
ncbi:MAG: acetyl-CoA carboxylase biotin carboxyl carrier protein subunit [SAR202 cluster bacterium]|nr:acetyl-CoA carboxylase biotin carboxyl carrier protein subunit [SAR202 cluster bacterium]